MSYDIKSPCFGVYFYAVWNPVKKQKKTKLMESRKISLSDFPIQFPILEYLEKVLMLQNLIMLSQNR